MQALKYAKGAIVLSPPDDMRRLDGLDAAATKWQGQDVVVVHDKIREARMLAAAGVEIDSPILRNYSWPGRWKPRANQRVTAAFMTMHDSGYVLNEMRTGKTYSTLWAFDYLKQCGLANRLLIISPLTTVRNTWGQAAFEILPHRTCAIAHGTRRQRVDAIQSGSDIIVMNHDGVKVTAAREAIMADPTITHVIVDEATAFRDVRIKRWKALKVMVEGRGLWLMTGTPTPQGPVDAHGLALLLDRPKVPRSRNLWQEMVGLRAGPFGWTPRPEAAAMVHEALQPAILVRRRDCFDMPPVTTQTIDVELTAEQKEISEALQKQWVSERDGGITITAANAAVRMAKLLQVFQGAVIVGKDHAIDVDCTPRLEALEELIEQVGGKVIICAPFTAVIKKLEQKLGVRHSVAVIDGGVSATHRDTIIRKFQNADDPKILVCHPRTVSHGTTLTASDSTIWFGPMLSTETYQQANERMWKPGDRPLGIYHFVSSPTERAAFQKVSNNILGQDETLKMYNRFLAGELR